MASTIENGTPTRDETSANQRIDFNLEQPLRQFSPNGNDIMAGSTTAGATSSQSVPGPENATTLVSPTHLNGPQTLTHGQSQSTEVSIKVHAQTGSPIVPTNPKTHDNSQGKQISTPSDATECPTQTSFNQQSNSNTDLKLSTSSGSEAATVNMTATAPISAPAISPSVLNISDSSNVLTEISNGLPSTSITTTNTDEKAIMDIKATLDINTNPDSRLNSNSNLEIDDDELPFQPSQSNMAPDSGSLNPIIALTSTSASENILMLSLRSNGDKLVPSESAPTAPPGEVTDGITKVNPASTVRMDNQNIVFQPQKNPILRAEVEHTLRSLVGETAIDSKLVLRLARELKWAKNQIKESKDNANGSGEIVQPRNDVSSLVAECTRANNEIAQLRQQLSDIGVSYNSAVMANQKFDLELSKWKGLCSVKLTEMGILLERNRTLEVHLAEVQNQRDFLTKKCQILQIQLSNSQNGVGPEPTTRMNKTQSPMKSPVATGSSATAISRQHALMRRPSIVPTHPVSKGANATPIIPSQSPRQDMPMLSPTGSITSGSTPTRIRNDSPIASVPHGVIPLPLGQSMFEYQLQQMGVVGQQRQQQTGHSNPAVSPVGQFSPAHQLQQPIIPYQTQLSNQQNPAQNHLPAHYITQYSEKTLKQRAYILPGMVPQNAAADKRPVMPPGHQVSQPGEGHMQMQLRKDLPLTPFSVPGTQPTPPMVLSQQLSSQLQQLHSQTVSSFSQNVQTPGGSQPRQHQNHHASVPPTPMTTAFSPGSPGTQNQPQANPHASQRQSQETSLEHPNVIAALRSFAKQPRARHSYPPQSYVMSPSQVLVQPYTLQAAATQHLVPQDTQATSLTTDASRTVIDLTMDEGGETEAEPPKKKQKVEETQSESEGTIMTLAEASPILDEKQVAEGAVESTVVDAGQPVEITPDQADVTTTMVAEPKNESRPQLLVDGLDILDEEFTKLLADIFEDSENNTSLKCCFFCAYQQEEDPVGWPEVHLQNQNPTVEDMVNHLKKIHAPAWENILADRDEGER